MENARKLALVVACGDGEDGRPGERIEAAHANWACRLVERLVSDLLALVEGNLAETQYERDKMRVLKMIQKARLAGIRKAFLTNNTSRLDKTHPRGDSRRPDRVGAGEGSGRGEWGGEVCGGGGPAQINPALLINLLQSPSLQFFIPLIKRFFQYPPERVQVIWLGLLVKLKGHGSERIRDN